MLYVDIKTYVLTLDCRVMLEQLDLILNELAQVLEALGMLCFSAVFILQEQVELSASVGGFLLMSLLTICLSKQCSSLKAIPNISAVLKWYMYPDVTTNVRPKQMLLRLHCLFSIC